MDKSKITSFLEGMPKTELHIHLEGSIPINAMWELVQKYNGTGEVKNIEELKNRFNYTDFPHFIETWRWKNKFIMEYEDFALIAEEFAKDMIAQNIKYTEVFYSPPDHKPKNLGTQKITEAVRKGFEPYKDKVKINLVADLVRDNGPENALVTLNEINEVKHMGVIGIGIGGSEQDHPPEAFASVYQKARELGFRTSAHAGEAAGSESIWGVLKELNAERIGHGTRAFEDEKLVAHLIEKQIPVEMCPISNVRTGVVKNILEHPLKDYYKKGMNVFLNTDDPKMFNNTMVDEYSAFIEMGFGLSDAEKLAMNAIASAWCTEEVKQSLKNEINNYFSSNNSKI